MTNYKDTLNLPKTDFPMKANLANREPGMLSQWAQQDLYAKIQQHTAERPSFILHDGPPYANGNIHLGHALNKILKDIIIKSKTQSGYHAPYVPGWDCHGLPIELFVEKKYGKANHKITPAAFREKCREYAQSQIVLQREDFKRLGIFGDWEKPYLTMNFQYEANIIRALAKIIKRGHLQQGYKPVYWCLDCQSALAEAEVEYHTKKSSSIDVKFKVDDIATFKDRFKLNSKIDQVSFPIWTTTPWSLPGNQAVAINPDIDYIVIEIRHKDSSELLILAEALYESCVSRFALTDNTKLGTIPGHELASNQVTEQTILLAHPLEDRLVPLVAADHVTTEDGTGCVHTAPAHGPDDYALAISIGIPVTNPIADNGCYYETVPHFAGKHVSKVNEPMIEKLLLENCLLHREEIEHSYPHCWRHKTPTIFRATPQWFISMTKEHLSRDALEAIDQVEWIPDWGKERITGMVAQRPDWCISRQRHWGVPIPVFVHHETKEIHPNTLELMEQVAVAVEENGVDAWFDAEVSDFLPNETDYIKVTDTLDVWFDSGVSHFSVLANHPDLAAPANLYLEGSDQHRGWFQSSLLTSIAMSGTAPYQQVLTHGFTVDEQGYKMSKSRGNVIAPNEIISKYGADILRLWVAACDYRTEPSLSDEILKRISDNYRRIRNTCRYLLSNLFDFEPNKHSLKPSECLALDQYITNRCYRVQQEVNTAYQNYQFHTVVQKIHHFCSIELGSFYLDIIKDRQYTTRRDSICRRSCQTAMHHILQALVRWLAPILSFTAEEVWSHLPDKPHDSVHMSTWYEGLNQFAKESDLNQDFWSKLIEIRNEVNRQLEAARKNGTIGSSLEAEVTLYCDPQIKTALSQLGDEARFVFITSALTIKPYSEKPVECTESEIQSLAIHIHRSTHKKCARCWHHQSDVGSYEDHPELCGRCVKNLSEPGEQRQYA